MGQVRDPIDCDIAGAIYRITCKCCGGVYIGESGNALTRRITQHVGQIKKALDPRLSQADRENIRATAGAQSRFYLHFARADHSQLLANCELVAESLLIEVL